MMYTGILVELTTELAGGCILVECAGVGEYCNC